jgi:hypothetical protein
LSQGRGHEPERSLDASKFRSHPRGKKEREASSREGLPEATNLMRFRQLDTSAPRRSTSAAATTAAPAWSISQEVQIIRMRERRRQPETLMTAATYQALAPGLTTGAARLVLRLPLRLLSKKPDRRIDIRTAPNSPHKKRGFGHCLSNDRAKPEYRRSVFDLHPGEYIHCPSAHRVQTALPVLRQFADCRVRNDAALPFKRSLVGPAPHKLDSVSTCSLNFSL